jgi:phosphohistidine phosphatase
MRLCLIRHGEAVDESVEPDRPLTEQGRRHVADVASQLQAAGLCPRQILHSGKTRAAQTAAILNEFLHASGGLARIAGLKPNDPPDAIVERIATWNDDIALVGHLPSLERIARKLLGSGVQIRGFPAAGAAVLERCASEPWHLVGQFDPTGSNT